MKKFLALLLASMMAFSLVACGEPAAPAAPAEGEAPAAAADFKVGVILIGDENEGYSYAHIEGVKQAATTLGLKEDQIIFKYSIKEDESCQDTANDLVEQGCKLIFANSFGHESYLKAAAQENPDVMFCHATGTSAAATSAKDVADKVQPLPNFCNYFTNIYEARYVSGVVAGLKLKEMMDAGEVTDPHIGYVGAYPYAEVVSGYTAFFLGIRSIVPTAYMDVTYTNSWFDITAEGEAANALMAKGCVIIGQHADSTGAPAAVEAARTAGKNVYCVGYNVDMLSVAPTAALTSSQNNWAVDYTTLIGLALEGKTFEKNYTFGFKDGGVMISTLGESCTKDTAAKVTDVINGIKDGSIHVFDTKTFTVGDKELTSYDKSFGFEGTQLIWDGYFHESEVVSAPLFDIRIDGITELQ
ncbi:MAG: BMP family ABC transporter substrate-binding protein [Oscillospiraceae bacterium]